MGSILTTQHLFALRAIFLIKTRSDVNIESGVFFLKNAGLQMRRKGGLVVMEDGEKRKRIGLGTLFLLSKERKRRPDE